LSATPPSSPPSSHQSVSPSFFRRSNVSTFIPANVPRNPHGIISFADPHPLNSVVSYRYKIIGGLDPPHFSNSRHLSLAFRPLSVSKPFRTNTYETCPIISALTPFRMNTSGSVHSKALYPPLKSTLLKNRGGGTQLLLTRNAKKHFYPEGTIGSEGSLFKCRRGFPTAGSAYSVFANCQL
jgi:hypothetical protein